MRKETALLPRRTLFLRLLTLLLLAQLAVPAALLPVGATGSLLPRASAAGVAATGAAGAALAASGAGGPPAIATPAPRRDGKPSLELSWSTREVQAGVPVTLTVRALDAAGRAQSDRGGAVQVLLDDRDARVEGGRALPEGRGRRVRASLSGGVATLRVTFAAPGRQRVEAGAEGSPDVTGLADDLLVHPTRFAIQGPATADQWQPARFTVVAQDERGGTVDGYSGPVEVTTSDSQALVEDPATGERPSPNRGGHRFVAADHGAAAVTIGFARSGHQTVQVRAEGQGGTGATLAVDVRPATTAAATTAPGATMTPCAGHDPAARGVCAVVASTAAPASPCAVATPGAATPFTCGSATPFPTATPTATPGTSPSPTATATAAATPAVCADATPTPTPTPPARHASGPAGAGVTTANAGACAGTATPTPTAAATVPPTPTASPTGAPSATATRAATATQTAASIPSAATGRLAALGAAGAGSPPFHLGGLLYLAPPRAVLAQAASYAATILADGPVAYWRLGEAGGALADATGHGHTGTALGGMTYGLAGAIQGDADTALGLDGSSGAISVPADQALDGKGSMTLEAWVNLAGGGATVIDKNPGSDNTNYRGFIGSAGNPGDTRPGYWNGSQAVFSPTSLTTGAWHQVVSVLNSGMLLIYIDGSPDSSFNVGFGPTNSRPLNLGRDQAGRFFNGRLDEVAVYGSALSTAQVQAHYRASGRTPPAAPTLQVTAAASATNAGVPVTVTVRALNADGTTNTGYGGTVSLASSDPAMTAVGVQWSCNGSVGSRPNCYTFSAADAGQHTFAVSFNTAGAAQTLSAADVNAPGANGAGPPVAVAETYLAASVGATTAQAGGSAVALTLQVKDAAGNLLTGYRGQVHADASYASVSNWGGGLDGNGNHTFAAADNGSLTLNASFRAAGHQTVTFSDTAQTARQASATIAVTGAPAGTYQRAPAPAGALLPDGSTLWAFVSVPGRLYVRHNVDSVTDPVWGPLTMVRDVQPGGPGADVPALVAFGGKVALFHTYGDGTYAQVWVTTSADSGATWSAPQQLTHETVGVQRVQAVTVGGTLYLFWSRQDTDGLLQYATTTDLSTWSAPAAVGRAIGVNYHSENSFFGIGRTAGGAWVLGWLDVTFTDEYGSQCCHYDMPTVHVATSADLASWSAPVQVTRVYGEHTPFSVAIAQDPRSGEVALLTEQDVTWDQYITVRTSGDGVSWSAGQMLFYDHGVQSDGSSGPNGGQGYYSMEPGLVAGTTYAVAAEQVCNGRLAPCYGQTVGGDNASIGGVGLEDLAAPGQPLLLPFGADTARTVATPTCPCQQRGGPIDSVTGGESTAATDLAVPAKGGPLAVTRAYRSVDAVAGQAGPFGVGWSWRYGVRAEALKDGSVAIAEANGRRAVFWKQGSGWAPAADVNATLAAGSGGGWVLTRHDRSVWTFDGSGTLLSIADPNGNTQTLAYSGGKLSGISAAGGRSLTITTDASGRITQVAGPLNLAASYTYDAAGNLATATDAAGGVTRYSYDDQHRLLTITDADGHVAESNTYGGDGRVTKQVDAAGAATAFVYNLAASPAATGMTRVTDPLGNETDYSYDAGLRLVQRDAHSGDWGGPILRRDTWAYDANNDVTSATDGDGVATAFTYDAGANLLTKTVDPSGLNLTWSFTYNALNEPLTATNPLGHTTTFTYDSRGNRLTAADALNHATSSAYDASGQLTGVTDADQHTTTFGYDPAGDLTTVTAPDDAATTMAYDAAGRATAVTDPLQHTTTSAYDGMGRVTSVTNALNQATTATYDAVGNRTKVTDPLGRATSYAYDAKDRLTTVTDPLNQATTYAYDAADNRTSVTDPNGHATTSTYDALHRVTGVKDALGDATTFAYDADGNRTGVTDALGHATVYAYDHANRLVGVTDALNHATTYAYDAAGNRTGVTDANGHAQTFAYDAANRLLTAADALGDTTRYAYDPAGNLTQATLPTGAVNRSVYDARATG